MPATPDSAAPRSRGAILRRLVADGTVAIPGAPIALAAKLIEREGFDAICFLDADNWYEPGHVRGCLDAVAAAPHAVDYVVARRRFVREDGRPLVRAFDEDATPDRAGHIDTNCFFLLRGAYHALGQWILVPKPISLLGDRAETVAIKNAFGAHASRLAVSSTKSMTGHLLGAAGGIEAVFSVLAIRDQVAPPTINLVNQDPQCDLDYVPNTARQMKIGVALSNSFGFGGTNGSLVFRKL